MNQRNIQFQVGLFTIVTCLLGAGLVLKFSKLRTSLQPTYLVAVHFDSAPGLRPGVPVQRHGMRIGRVHSVDFDEERGGLAVQLRISEQYNIHADSQIRQVNSLLGDVSVEVIPGRSRNMVQPSEELEGQPPADPMNLVKDLNTKVGMTLGVFSETSNEWREVARNMNKLMVTHEGTIDTVIERAAASLARFSETMTSANHLLMTANEVLGDPKQQQNLKQTLEALPALVNDTRGTVQAVELAVTEMTTNLRHISNATRPLADHSDEIVTQAKQSLVTLDALLAELNQFSRTLNREDGSLQRLVSEPDLYVQLQRSVQSLSVMLKNLEPATRDLQIFSDKVARHPELLGVSGAMKGSSGLKEPADESGIQPAGFNRPAGTK